MSLSKQLFFGLTLFLILPFMLGGCEKYKEIRGAFVSYSFKNQVQIDLKDDPDVPNYIKIIVLDKDEIEKFLSEKKIDTSSIPDKTLFNSKYLCVLVYGWGLEPAMQQNICKFSTSYIAYKRIWTPFDDNNSDTQTRKLFTYSTGYNQGASVTEFLDLYIFKKEDLINYETNKIQFSYDFRFKATYDFEKEQKWGEVSGNIEFEVPTENVTSNEIIQLPIR